jgi:hypothetical protein
MAVNRGDQLWFETLEDLVQAYRGGQLNPLEDLLWLDNDTASVYLDVLDDDGEAVEHIEVYHSYPEGILSEALDLLNVPHDHV